MKKVLIIIFAVLCSYFLTSILLQLESKTTTDTFVPPYPTLPKPSSGLETVVKKAMEGSKGTYGILIKNMKTNEIFYSNEHTLFEAGSLYKLWIMAVTFEQIEKGRMHLSDELYADIAKLNETFNIATEEAGLTEGEIDVTVASALKQMITISHNYSALLLTQRVGITKVKQFLKDNNFQESLVGQPPKTTAYDSAVFFEKLYNHAIVSPEKSQAMLDLLKQQTLNNKLPLNFPDDVQVAHKTGEIGMFTHDAGIVYSPKGDYIIVVLSESDYPPGAEERIATLSRSVYDYFNE